MRRLIVALALLLTALPYARASDQEALDALGAAYPTFLTRHDGRLLYWRDGTTMPVGDGRNNKSFDALLREASILDQFRIPYRRGATAAPARDEDPGRFRNAAFFRKMYG
ncbi:MAG: M15 family metallopeptidase, partial [Pseudolabrys sp.]